MEPEIKTGEGVVATAKEVDKGPIPTKEEMLLRVTAQGAELRKLILDAKRMPREKALEPHQDELRCLAQAQTNLQTGLMWLKRAINPTREF